MTRRARCTLLQGALALVFVSIALPRRSAAQVCPVDRYCFYVPPGLPLEASHSNASSRSFDIVLSSPTGDVSGSYSVAGRPPVAITVSPGHSLRIPLSVSDGPASAYQAPESRGVFLVADSPNLTVDHRETFDQEQYSETIKRSAIALGSRFRLGGYSLNLEQRPLAGVDSVLIYAPTGASVTLTAPPSATLPFWSGSASTSYTATLGAGQTLAVRTEVGRDIDGALLTSSAPVAVSTGGRGWSEGGCGDDGMDGLVPTSALGREHVVRLPTGSYASNGESRVRVIADVDGTEVRVDGALVATLAAGAFYSFEPTALSYVQTSRPALVWMNGSLDGCELDTVLIPPIAFLPALTELSLDFNVIASNQTPSAELAILIATPQVASIRLDGAAPPLISSDPVPGRADLTYVRFDVTPGDHNVRAGADFQALLASRTQPSGLLAYYNPYRIPGCGDGALDAGEGCDDGNPSDGDGCSASCVVEPGYGCSGLPSACVTLCGDGSLSQPSESCDDGNTAAGDGCNVTCRREVTIAAPPEGASLRALPNVSGTADPLATITLSIGSSIALLHADSQGAWSSTPTAVTSDGPVMITASATDLRGGLSTAARTLRIDTMTSVAIAEPRSGATLTSATPTLRGTGEPGAQLELRVDDRVIGSLTVGPEGTWTFQVTEPLRDGAHGVTARSQDAAGNRASATSDFRVDTRSGPFLLIHNLPDGAFTHDPRPLFSGAADPGAQVIVTFDDVTLDTLRATARGSWTLSLIEPLQPGTH
ncbi:MAG: internalin, partial [Myxococcaceae bacterium]|nr:internalin [Myxococcaceae bacterium]